MSAQTLTKEKRVLLSKKYWIKYLIIGLVGLSLNFSVIAENDVGDATIGASKIIACTGCHGANGNSIVPAFPSLAGQDAKYIVKQINDFKNGSRSNPLMNSVVAAISLPDIEHIGAYYAAQTKTPVIKSKDKTAILALGKKLYENGNPKTGQAACFTCHGKEGKPLENFAIPILRNQQPLYTISTLKAFKDKQRTNDRERAMSRIIATMNDEQIEAVSYYSSYLTTE